MHSPRYFELGEGRTKNLMDPDQAMFSLLKPRLNRLITPTELAQETSKPEIELNMNRLPNVAS